MNSRGKKMLSLVKECQSDVCVSSEYDFEEKKQDPLHSYKSWKDNGNKSHVNKTTLIQESTVDDKPNEGGGNFSGKPNLKTIVSTERIIGDREEPIVDESVSSIESQLNSSESWKASNEDIDNESTSTTSIESHQISAPDNNIQEEIKQKCRQVSHNTKRINANIEISRRKGRVWDKKDRCSYCYKDVTNFSRHLSRKHKDEVSVSQILNLPKGSKERKNLFALLRKEGNFSVISENIIRPVQRPTSGSFEQVNNPLNFLPCVFCKGLYKKISLNKHVKRCSLNKENNSRKRFSSEGQTLLAFQESRTPFLHRLRLKSEVFNTMHADAISFIGKSDIIVCAYAEAYLRKHKRPHIKNLVSNKIRELGRLLLMLRDTYNIHSMLEALKPQNFHKVVSSARIVAGYDEAKKEFRAPSLALHYGTTLLAICDAATSLVLQKEPILPVTDYDVTLKEIKQFRHLVSINWKFEMGSLALKDLTEKNSLKSKTLPITKDILLFQAYCYKIADESIKILKEQIQHIQAFKNLSEATVALTILINRKRVGDVQYMKLKDYQTLTTASGSEECSNVLSEEEKHLAKHFKRVTTVGKRNKIVPVLFSTRLQEFVQMMLEVRNRTTIIPVENPFLFALCGSPSKWIDGSTVLRNYAVACGAAHPATLTSSRLRKQIATVLQLLNLDNIEMEQVATFMGHTRKTHEEFYRLPQEVFQTSKVAKLLLLMERGINPEDQGKTLNEIDDQLQIWDNEATVLNDVEDEESREPSMSSLQTAPSTSTRSVNKSSNSTLTEKSSQEKHPTSSNRDKSKCRGSWTQKHKTIMLNFFKKHIKSKISPKKDECLQLKNENLELFKDKNWLQIKVFVYNTYKQK